MFRNLTTLLVFVVLLLPATITWGQGIKIEGCTMGPIKYRVIVDPLPETVDQQKIAEHVQAELDSVNQAMSTYLDDSEVSRFNRSTDTGWFEVSLATAQVIQRSLEISDQTQGAFDITVGPLVNLWKFGRDKGEFKVPTRDTIESTLQRIGYTHLAVRFDPPAIKKSIPDLRIDLSAIAKGYAVDRVVEMLRTHSISGCMVEVGGEVRTLGTKSDGTPWKIGIEKPRAGQEGSYDHLVELVDAAMATSGDYRIFHVADGKSYSHTIDPTTGSPVTHSLASLSVIAGDCMSADAYATAGSVIGPDRLEEVLGKHVNSYFALVRNEDGFYQQASTGFPVIDVAQARESNESGQGSIIPMFIGAAVVFGLAIVGMAFGVIFSNKPISGSCGGLSTQKNEDGSSSCSLCQKPVSECPEKKADSESAPV